MEIWSVAPDIGTGGYSHRLSNPAARSIFVPLVGSIFELLAIPCSLSNGKFWWSLHSAPNLGHFETAYGVDAKRWSYNERCFKEVYRTRRTVLGRHAGLSDLLVPIVLGREVAAVLVIGPFLEARPTTAELIERWRSLTGRQAHLADSGFRAYLRATLSALVLGAPELRAFEKLLECLATLMAGGGPGDELANRADALRRELEPTRFVDRTWVTVQTMVTEHSSPAAYSAAWAFERQMLGLSRVPDHVLVALARAGTPLDPIEELVRLDALQRHAVGLARQMGDAVAGRVGEHGVVFLCAPRGSAKTQKQRLRELRHAASRIARQRFGFELYFGVNLRGGEVALSRGYQLAVGAAETALMQGRELVSIDDASKGATAVPSLRRLSDDLAAAVLEQPDVLPAQFDRYLEALAVSSRERPDRARVELEICFQRVADALLRTGNLDPKSCDSLRDELERSAGETDNLSDLFDVYRSKITDLSQAVSHPAAARQDQRVRRAIDFIGRHYVEPLSVAKVAAVAGFAPKYFSALFRKHEATSFESYVFGLRMDHAKRLLTGTDLTVTRVAELSGLRTPQYLCRCFRRTTKLTPLEYRASRRPHWSDAKRRTAKRRRARTGL